MTNNIILLMTTYTNRVDASYPGLGVTVIGNSGGGIAFDSQCPDGKIITDLRGNLGDRRATTLRGTCDDGTLLTRIGNQYTNLDARISGPLTGIVSKNDDFVAMLAGNGSQIAEGWDDQPLRGSYCPPGTYMAGYKGRHGDMIDQLTFICGPKISEFCIDNLEHPMCSDDVVNQDMLNAACRKNMSAKCIRRKNELYDSVISDFCVYFPNEPICSCYAPVPDTFPDQIKGLPPQCWNPTCAKSGYIPLNLRGVKCPDVKICNQNINLAGEKNILTDNIHIQDCSDKTTINQQPLPNTSGNEGVGAVNQPNPTQPNPPQPNQPTSTMTPEQIKIAYGINPTQQLEPTYGGLTIQNILYLFIMIIFVSIIGYAIYAYDSDDVEEPEIVTR